MLQRSLFRASRQAARSVQQPIQPAAFATIRQQAGARAAPAFRWYSDAAPAAEAKPTENAEEAKPDEVARLKEAVEKKEQDIIAKQDKYLRSIADYRNLQERTRREVAAAKDFAIQRFARDLIESVDDLDRALQNVPTDKLTPENPDLVTLYEGLKLTDLILINSLKRHGLQRFDPSIESEKFDPNKHEAVFHAPMKDKNDGTCFITQQKGFLLNKRVLRAAKVGVVKNS
ncbi:mitochondrial co-chaperone GrpE [Massarina eburnea CBS 473.64]|uniref:GrpE protein homolog n=1 Tax=Massarina eburnea CBS 473.64 TaxID=1395130 RepID=A0A6A6RMI0_9PLEO|nr:mitochondrial co-chaperone GrpE [Massarina eburnea CBS 473.64]